MKKSFPLVAICFLMVFSSAKANDESTEQVLTLMKSKYEKVKVYSQASTSNEIIAILERNETINFLRKAIVNGGIWSIVYVNGRPGYVLTAEIYEDSELAVKNKRRKKAKDVVDSQASR